MELVNRPIGWFCALFQFSIQFRLFLTPVAEKTKTQDQTNILKVFLRCTCDPQRVETCEQGTFLSILGFHGHSHQTPTPMFWLVDPR